MNTPEYYPPHPFHITVANNGIVYIEPLKVDLGTPRGYLETIINFAEILTTYLAKEKTQGIIYKPPFRETEINYRILIQEAHENSTYGQKLSTLLVEVERLKKQKKPLLALIDNSCSGIALAVCLWAHYKIALPHIRIGFPESKYGLFPGFAAIGNTMDTMEISHSIPFLIQGIQLSAPEAQHQGIIDTLSTGINQALQLAEDVILKQKHIQQRSNQAINKKEDFENLSSAVRKPTGNVILGVNAGLTIIESVLGYSDSKSISLEAHYYTQVLRNAQTMAILRTQYYGIRQAKTLDNSNSYILRRLGVLGAGMMGAGIAFEAARAEVEVFLKDVTLELALKGKSYADQVSSKLVQQGRMDDSQKEQLLARIHPITDARDLQHLDLVIEAVFEDKALKNTVTQETISSLREDGFFASNTTSLPISSLASVVDHPESFIGMHFFSPVDRMALVEIIRGKNTDDNTTSKALQVARQLGKVPIVINDGPAFFTSRIFFNYLLEAITMLLEGIPASSIEEEARKAGFAVGPLAVLDEISLGLMLHVYQQLPSLTNSQQKAYAYLESLVASGRNGRRTNQGFYNYSEGRKEIWQDPTLSDSETGHPKETIQKRLLHVMALDSYRCLADGILNRPIDGDIGSVLGIGYPPHTGGVFGHIDQTGLQMFVKECRSFADKGEQWEVPLSLQKLAEDNFTFYNNFDSNWK